MQDSRVAPAEMAAAPPPEVAERVVEVAPVAIVFLTCGGLLVRANPRARSILGGAADPEAWSGSAIARLIATTGLPALREHDSWAGRMTLPNPTGGELDISLDLRRLDEDHCALLITPVTTAPDVEDTARLMTALIDQTSDFVAWHGPVGSEARINPAAARLVGGPYRAGRPLPHRIRELFEPESYALINGIGNETLQSTGSWRARVQVRHRDTDDVRHLDWCMLLVRDDDGQVLASAGIGRDVTDQVLAGGEELQRRLVLAQEEERRRIAAEVHEDTAQALSAVSLRLQRLRRRLDDSRQDLLDESIAAVAAALGRLNRLIFDLHPAVLDSDGIGAALEQFLATLLPEDAPTARVVGADVDTTHLDPQVRTAVYRVAREAVLNAVSHAGATCIEVSLEAIGEAVCVRVTDDGAGFDPSAMQSQPGHLGLSSARDLIEAADGALDVYSAPGQGTGVQVWIGAGARRWT
jgi:signal transduction histidine kinase